MTPQTNLDILKNLDRLLKFWRKRGNSLSPLGHPRIVGPAPGVKPTNLRPQIWRQYLRSLGLGTDGNRFYQKKIANWLLTFRVQNAYWRHLTSKICSKLGGRERIQRVHAEMMFQNIKNMVVKWQLSLACVCLIYTSSVLSLVALHAQPASLVAWVVWQLSIQLIFEVSSSWRWHYPNPGTGTNRPPEKLQETC